MSLCAMIGMFVISYCLYYGLLVLFFPSEWKRAPRARFRPGATFATLPLWQRILLGLFALIFPILYIPKVIDGEVYAIVCVAFVAISFLWMALFSNEHDEATFAALNYRFEPDRCGACGYRIAIPGEPKLARCPECGWDVPLEEPRIEPPDWWILSRHQKKVHYLYDPKWTIRVNLRAILPNGVAAVAFGSLALVVYDNSIPFITVSALTAVQMTFALRQARLAARYAKEHNRI